MGSAIRPRVHSMSGARNRPRVSKAVAREGERFSLTTVIVFTLASTAISVYDLYLLIKLMIA